MPVGMRVDFQLDPFDYVLAENLHMTVETMEETMSNDEYVRWRAFYNYRAYLQEKADREAKNG